MVGITMENTFFLYCHFLITGLFHFFITWKFCYSSITTFSNHKLLLSIHFYPVNWYQCLTDTFLSPSFLQTRITILKPLQTPSSKINQIPRFCAPSLSHQSFANMVNSKKFINTAHSSVFKSVFIIRQDSNLDSILLGLNALKYRKVCISLISLVSTLNY